MQYRYRGRDKPNGAGSVPFAAWTSLHPRCSSAGKAYVKQLYGSDCEQQKKKKERKNPNTDLDLAPRRISVFSYFIIQTTGV